VIPAASEYLVLSFSNFVQPLCGYPDDETMNVDT